MSLSNSEPKKVRIEPNEIGDFLNMVAYSNESDQEESKENRHQLEIAKLANIFFLAKQQPELCDACIQYWDFTHTSIKAEESLNMWLEIFDNWRKILRERK